MCAEPSYATLSGVSHQNWRHRGRSVSSVGTSAASVAALGRHHCRTGLADEVRSMFCWSPLIRLAAESRTPRVTAPKARLSPSPLDVQAKA